MTEIFLKIRPFFVIFERFQAEISDFLNPFTVFQLKFILEANIAIKNYRSPVDLPKFPDKLPKNALFSR